MSEVKQAAPLIEMEAEPSPTAMEEIARWEDEGGAVQPVADCSLAARRLFPDSNEPRQAITSAACNKTLP